MLRSVALFRNVSTFSFPQFLAQNNLWIAENYYCPLKLLRMPQKNQALERMTNQAPFIVNLILRKINDMGKSTHFTGQ